MPLLRRKKVSDAGPAAGASGSDAGSIKEKKSPFAKKPSNTAFKQQRLKAWQPILTPRTVLPTLFLLGLVFAPIGAILYYYSQTVSELTIDYTGCSSLTRDAAVQAIPSDKVSYQLHGTTTSNFQAPQWQYVTNASAPNGATCHVFFAIPEDLEASVFLYYKLTNFYQNHRRYIKSLDSQQLLGQNRSASDLNDGECKPLGEQNGLAIYPCGLIANSVFNDTFSDPILLNSASSSETNVTYVMSENGIVWPGEKLKYKPTTMPANLLVPPPYWQGATGPFGVPSGRYSVDNVFDPSANEHFMVWMRVSGLPTFRKLYKRNDNDTMVSGFYRIDIDDNYPVSMFGGTKSIVLSTVSWVGGRNPFLGLAYIVVAGILLVFALVFTAHHLIRPRKLGDMALLSWNQEER
ncbi:Lem3/Cdc50 [Microstroma glucosiphilum]|uniref:Lem3/Cdc50 n=1 Tax=Pseudomicrostroma glucosiphilum TaxID=1684307 RepID=A0A316UCI0_9BASI|nr:Lem3/Cdc50 [Pseudomicrostroma glucosiphilum]PWN20725.1 Lem3/Cdc50 [Pseudomicrostroma glucosiphilum]